MVGVVIEMPLLTENQLHNTVDRVLLVDCDKKTQLERAVLRGNQSKEQILKIIEQQATRIQRREIADDIVLNSNGLESLEEQLKPLHQKYLKQAAATSPHAS